VKNEKEILNSWRNHLRIEKNKSLTTIEEYLRDIEVLLFFFELKLDSGPKTFDEITPEHVRSFLHYCSDDRENAATTVSRKVSSLNSFFNFVANKGMINFNPMEKIDYDAPRSKKLPLYLGSDQVKLILDGVDNTFTEFYARNKAMLALMAMAGLRVSEVTGIDIQDLNLKEKRIKLLGKGNKERYAYLNSVSYSLLTDYLDKRPRTKLDALFVSKKKNRISRHTIHWIVKKLVKNLDLNKKVSSHTLRHTFATLYHSAGMDIRHLQQLLGHSNLGTTEIYTHVVDSVLEKEVNEKDPFNS
jgi:site-specific recombinase XerD